MFVNGIEVAARFTRPIHSIIRTYGSSVVQPAAASLVMVNADGWALTCRHVTNNFAAADQLKVKWDAFRAARALLPDRPEPKRRRELRNLESQYGFGPRVVVEVRNVFVSCIDGPLHARWFNHPNPTCDIALVKFDHFTALHCTTFPVFASVGADLKPGKFLCRLGFPFPEFSNFEYDQAADEIRWTATGRQATPWFPIEGMVTRNLSDGTTIVGVEMSTPGLRGQSGGPLFDVDGRVWGIQSATNHLDLDFDVDQEVVRQGEKKRIRESAFLHVGHCVHVDVAKEFMRTHSVAFDEG
jgi:hypothetical protein